MDIFLVVFGVALLIGGPALAVWMIWVEPFRYRVRRFRAAEADLARSPDSGGPPRGLRILHITDTHFHGRDERKLQFLLRVACREEYDLALLTGDLLDTPDGVESCRELAEGLHPRVNSYAVLGGHDLYWSTLNVVLASMGGSRRVSVPARIRGEPERLRRELERGGVRVLQDESEVVDLGRRGRMAVVGTRDAQESEPDYDAAWADVPENIPSIALAHSPDAVPEIAARGPDMAFCGHTHGGQVRLPGVGALVTRSGLPPDRASGMFRDGETLFFLNNGVGTNRFLRFRLFCRPEVGLVSVTG